MPKHPLTEGSKHAIATSVAKRKGFTSFKIGSAGALKRSDIAESLARKRTIVPEPATKDAIRRRLRKK